MKGTRLLAALLAVLGQACGDLGFGPSDSSDEGSSNGVAMGDDLTEKFSILSGAERQLLAELDHAVDLQGKQSVQYPFCIHTVGSAAGATPEATVLGWATQAMNEWIAPLQGQTGWRVSNAKAYDVEDSGGRCPVTDRGLKVYEISLELSEGGNNSGFVMRVKKAVQYIAIIHEMGHGIGLGDEYSIPGAPPSVMNNGWKKNGGLTRDDIDAVRFLWARIRGGRGACPSGYEVKIGSWGETHCFPTGGGGSSGNGSGGNGSGGNGSGGNGGGGTCTDTYKNKSLCRDWAAQGECQRNPGFMLSQCCGSCKGSGTPDPDPTCRDAYGTTLCQAWAAQGECERRPGSMRTGCCQTCKLASQ